MSCDGNDSFGYVKIEDDMVVAYTGESNNPTVHKFCNDDIVQAVKLQELMKNRIELLTEERKIFLKTFKHGEVDTHIIDFKIEELEKLLEESKK